MHLTHSVSTTDVLRGVLTCNATTSDDAFMAGTVQRAEIDVLIGQRVHHVLWRRKLQQRDVAAAMGITQSTLSRRLRGESAWFAGDLVALAEVLGVSVGWLFGEETVVRPKGFEPLTFWTVLWEHVKRVANRYTRNASRITCPRCGRTSYNPNDVREGYCGSCHDWTDGVRADDYALAS